MTGPELCPKCKGLHFKTAPCVVRKLNDVATELTPEVLQLVIGRDFSRSVIDMHRDRIKRPVGRPKTITDMRAYKAMKAREYRARPKPTTKREKDE